ncbi:kinase-like protein, partial [Clavulina sp. PMI_390]
QLVRREIISQIHVQHPNILPILGISSDEKHPLSIITPFAQNGNAFQYLTGLAARDMSRKTIAMFKIMSQVASALEYLHNMDPQIIHGDLHGRNILVDAEGNGLLSDFGLSRFKHEDTRTATNIVEGGKFRYIAPELFAPSLTQFRTTVQSDCYAFAMTILELATLERPFAEFDNERKAFTAAERGVRPQRAPLAKLGMQSEELADRLWTLLGDMWVQAHLKRPTMYTVNARLVDILCQTLSDR